MKTQMTMAEAPATIRSTMEHRWGTRLPMDLPVNLDVEGQRIAAGRMLNASISGALIATSARLPMLAVVKLSVLHGPGRQGLELKARIVRNETDAIAIEWLDMSCDGLVSLLRVQDASAKLWARDRVFD
jgi:hypothetical protein